MSTPRASVVLPVFDAAPWLATCLRSLQRQTVPDWECILVDDGSRDASLEIARHFAKRDPRFRVIATKHAGLVAALECGVAQSRAEILVRMDADDWMHRERLAQQCAALDAAPELSATGTHVRIFPRATAAAEDERALPGEADRIRTGRLGYESWLNSIETPGDIERNAWIECPIAHPTLAIRRACLERVGYRDTPWPEDYDLVLRLLAAGESLAVVPRRLLAWRDREERLSRQSPRYQLEAFATCKAAHLASSFLANASQYILWGYGGTGRRLAARLRDEGRIPSHIVDVHPRRIGQTIGGAKVIAPEALAALPIEKLVASVAGSGPREQIRARLAALGYREGRDFVCAA